MKRRVCAIIRGRVQGVCFRMCACEQATRLGLTGWVRNRQDGCVETVAEGEEAPMDEFLAWCRHGPPHARVTDVDEQYSVATGEFDEFTITD